MDSLDSGHRPAFTRLPIELLEQILDYNLVDKSNYSYWRSILDVTTLKSLRLACKQYAYLPKLMEDLFHRVQLVASPEQAQLAHVTDLSPIRPYVRAIVMKPTKYSWEMTEQIFEDILLIAPLQEFCDDVREKICTRRDAGEDVSGAVYLGRDQFAELGMRGFVQKYMNGEMPFSAQEIRAGYSSYMNHAKRTRDAFESGDMMEGWIKALVQLPDVSTFTIRKWAYDYTTKEPWRNLGCEITGHQHHYGKGHEEAVCRRLQEPVGEALFITACSSLEFAYSKITDLTIKSVVDGKFEWADYGELRDLRLYDLESLSFQPIGAEDYTSDAEARLIGNYSFATTTLLEKCYDNLKILDICSHISPCPMPWPPQDLRPLPNLTSFRTCLTLRLTAFATFLHNSPLLSHLILDSCHGKDGPWRDLWDAIRNHPSRMELELQQLPCVDWTELGVHHHTGEASKCEFVEDLCERIDYSMENYLSGTGPWDKSLRWWFGDSYDSSEDEDEDEDDDDEGENDDNEDEEDVHSEDEMKDVSGDSGEEIEDPEDRKD